MDFLLEPSFISLGVKVILSSLALLSAFKVGQALGRISSELQEYEFAKLKQEVVAKLKRLIRRGERLFN